MTGELTRAQLENENELICAMLLGLKQVSPHSPPSQSLPDGEPAAWTNGRAIFVTPLFVSWVGCQMLLDAFVALSLDFTLYYYSESPTAGTQERGWYIDIPELSVGVGPFPKGPEAIRAAAVAVVNNLRDAHVKRKVPN